MKIIFIFLLILFHGISYSQKGKLEFSMRTCLTGIQKAINDFDQGYYYCESLGLKADLNPEFTKFYKSYIKIKYGIIYGNDSCIVDDFRKCYSEKMSNLIVEKFGKDIFEKSLKEAKTLYLQEKYEHSK